MPSKKETIELLEEIADMLEFKEENRFKIQAYRAGAVSLKKFGEDFEKIVLHRELNKIKGIGTGLQKIIYEFYDTNESSLYKSLRNEIPEGLEQLIKIKGLNPKKIKQLNSDLGISNLEELEKAAEKNLLVNIKGFGDNLQKKILLSLKDYKKYKKFILFSTALMLSDDILKRLLELKSVAKAEKSGELRRGSEVVSRLDFVILILNKNNFLLELKELFSFTEENSRIVIDDYSDVSIFMHYASKDSDYCQKLFLTTGSKEFVSSLGKHKIDGSTEEEIFSNMQFPFVIPEMREKEYFEQKKSLRNNSKLTMNDLKGILHFHTTFSDGKNSLEEMINAAKELDFHYAAVNDHSRTAYYANGLDEVRVLKQIKEVKRINSENNLQLFSGTEVDILINGDLDFNDEFLINFDFVVASIHSRFNLKEKEMTKRIIRAIENPFVDVLAHPSGRLLLSRAPYKFNIKKIIDACAANQVAIELNSSPKRLDLEWRWLYYAREKGCLFSINPDAHSISEISYLIYGIVMGRKAGLQPDEVINCFSLSKFKRFLNRKVKRKFKY